MVVFADLIMPQDKQEVKLVAMCFEVEVGMGTFQEGTYRLFSRSWLLLWLLFMMPLQMHE